MKKYENSPKDYFTPFMVVMLIGVLIRVIFCIIIAAQNGAFDNLF